MVFNFFAFNVLPPKEHESGNRYFFPVLFASGMCPSADPQKAQMQVSASPFIWCLEKCINAIVIGIFSELQDPKEQTAWAQAFFCFTSTFTGFFGSWLLTFRRRLTRRFQKTGRDDAIWSTLHEFSLHFLLTISPAKRPLLRVFHLFSRVSLWHCHYLFSFSSSTLGVITLEIVLLTACSTVERFYIRFRMESNIWRLFYWLLYNQNLFFHYFSWLI